MENHGEKHRGFSWLHWENHLGWFFHMLNYGYPILSHGLRNYMFHIVPYDLYNGHKLKLPHFQTIHVTTLHESSLVWFIHLESTL